MADKYNNNNNDDVDDDGNDNDIDDELRWPPIDQTSNVIIN